MKLYPICLKLENTACCVIGGGNIALRKVKALLETRAKITLISPKLCRGLQALRKKKVFHYINLRYQKRFLKGKNLIIAATNDEKVNKKIADDAFSLNLLVNVVDSPDSCNFYIPSVLRKGDILMTISTQGRFPGLAKKIKEECRPVFEKYSENLPLLSKLRQEINQQFKNKPNKKKLILEKIIQPVFLNKLNKKNRLQMKLFKELLQD